MKNEKECVYFIKHKGMSPIKIGYSSNENPKNRVESFKTASPYGIELIGYIQSYNAKILEKELHERFSAFRLNGEWFSISEKIVKDLILMYDNSFYQDVLKYKTNINSKIENNEYFDFFNEVIPIDLELENHFLINKYKQYTGDVITGKKIQMELSKWADFHGYEIKRRKAKTRYFTVIKSK